MSLQMVLGTWFSHRQPSPVSNCLAEAPACRLGTLARAAVSDGADNVASLREAAKVHPTHGERDAHRILNKFMLTLRVPISDVKVVLEDGQVVSIPHYKVLVFKTIITIIRFIHAWLFKTNAYNGKRLQP